jgi:hypothetical protein
MSVGGLAFLAAAIGVAQKWRNDRRESWWDRTEWALAQLEGTEQARTVALLVLAELVTSKLATKEEAHMLEQIGLAVLNEEST